jgi:hypothetical protein
MSLQNKLDEFRKQFEAGAPPEALALMHRATDDLSQSGILENVIQKEEKAPEFALPNTNGELTRSSELLGKGPLVVSFYRGVW